MSNQRFDAPMPSQVSFWNQWNATARENQLDKVSLEQRERVLAWLDRLGGKNLDIIEVGCGAGWLSPHLTDYGRVTGTDLAHEVLARAAKRNPTVTYVAGDFMALEFPQEAFDVAVSLEVLSHVADQPAFIGKVASLLKPGGFLMLATQNCPQLKRNKIPAPMPGQIRHWVDRHELSKLLDPYFKIEQLFSITPQCNRGPLRIVNSHKLNSLLTSVGLGVAVKRVKLVQEQAWLGWTLMCLAQKHGTTT